MVSAIQWKPLNVITLGQRQTDNINQMITITEGHYLGVISHLIIEKDESENRMFPLFKLKQITVN